MFTCRYDADMFIRHDMRYARRSYHARRADVFRYFCAYAMLSYGDSSMMLLRACAAAARLIRALLPCF